MQDIYFFIHKKKTAVPHTLINDDGNIHLTGCCEDNRMNFVCFFSRSHLDFKWIF